MSTNPFEFEAAIRFSPEEMVDYFIDDHNFARFVDSQRNIFLLGDRGTGKTMILRYYSFMVQVCKHRREGTIREFLERPKNIGVYVPCRSIAIAKPEAELVGGFAGRLVSEHLLVVSLIAALAEALESAPEIVSSNEEEDILSELQFILHWELPEKKGFFGSLKAAARRESVAAQRALNQRNPDSSYDDCVSFASSVVPAIEVLISAVERLQNAHFSFLFDDADYLSDTQNEILNSWIASRDNARISFKVATSLVDQKPLTTYNGGELLERHDFIKLNLEQDFQSSEASFHHLAEKIVQRRLEKFNIARTPDEFFPMNPTMKRDLEAAEAEALKEAERLYGSDNAKKIRDYVYKYHRAFYFRNRSTKANRPPYSGFSLIVHVSTGVIRYLLEPCYEMYDQAVSQNGGESVNEVKPAIQTERLNDLSNRRWDWVRNGISKNIRGCTRDDARFLSAMLESIAVLFYWRLHNHQSEPRAITFVISNVDGISEQESEGLFHIINIARRAQILFRRVSSGKDDGERVTYYTFDRLLWVTRGLDPVGQNAFVSIEAKFLYWSTFHGFPLPTSPKEKSSLRRRFESINQSDLFGADER